MDFFFLFSVVFIFFCGLFFFFAIAVLFCWFFSPFCVLNVSLLKSLLFYMVLASVLSHYRNCNLHLIPWGYMELFQIYGSKRKMRILPSVLICSL